MGHLDNPAGRLHEVLSAVRGGWSAKIDVDLAGVWYAVLSVESQTEFLLAIAALNKDVSELVLTLHLNAEEISTSQYVDQVGTWARSISQESWNWDTSQGPDSLITKAELGTLALLSDLLHLKQPEGIYSNQKVGDLLQSVNGLHNEILSADDLPPELRDFLLRNLSRIQEALRNFRLYGPLRLDEEFGRTIAETIRDEPISTSEETGGIMKRFWAIVAALPLVAQRTGDANKIVANAHETIGQITDGLQHLQ